MNNSGIYKISNTITNKIYIGSSINIKSRWYKHIYDLKKNNHHSNIMQLDFNKYGINSFKFEILEECDKNNLKCKEQFYIDKYQSYINGYNILKKSDSFLGYKHTYETKMKISKAFSGKNHPLYGTHQSEESKLKNRLSNLGQIRDDNFKNKMKIKNKGEGNPRSKLSENDVKIIIELINNGQSNFKISEQFNVSRQMIQRIRSNKAWTHIPR